MRRNWRYRPSIRKLTAEELGHLLHLSHIVGKPVRAIRFHETKIVFRVVPVRDQYLKAPTSEITC